MVHSCVHCGADPFGALGDFDLADGGRDSSIWTSNDSRRTAAAAGVCASVCEERCAERKPDGTHAAAGARILPADGVFGNPPSVWRIPYGRHYAEGTSLRAVCS